MKIKAKLVSERWYSPDTNWGTFTVKVLSIIEKKDEEEDINMDKMLNIAGNIFFRPETGVEYVFEGEYKFNVKYGWQFEIFSGYEDVHLDTPEEKRLFLEQILTERQVENLYKTYQDPFTIIEEDRIDELVKVDGIGEYLAEKIIGKFKATKNLAPAYNFFRPLGVSVNLISKICVKYGDAYKAIDAFKENPYILADDIDGVGFIKADEIARNYKFDMNHPFRIKAGILYLLKDHAQSNGSTWMKSSTFKSKIVQLLGIEFQSILPTFEELVKSEDIYINKTLGQIALKYYYDLEAKIKNKLMELVNAEHEEELVSTEELLDNIHKTEEKQGFEFTDEQRQGIIDVIKNNVTVVIGSAGTGKTSVIKGAYEALPDYINVAQCAFSGQASKRINEATGYPSSTIHRLLGYSGGGFECDENNPLFHHVIVIDEISMVGLELFWCLIRAIRQGAKLVMLGDSGQLPPIGVGNLLSDLISSKVIPVVELTKIHRQAAKSAIITTSQKVRQRKMLFEPEYEGNETLGELQDLCVYARQERTDLFDLMIETFMEEYHLHNDNPKDVQIIVAQNKKVALSREMINKKIQDMINPLEKHKNEAIPEVKIGQKQVVRIGDKVINRKNHYDVNTTNYETTNIFNGSMGIVKEIYKTHMVIDFFDEGEIILKPDKYIGLELAYAITCHSSQGSQFKVVLVGFDYSSYIMLSNEWLYTALTRAKNKCYMIAETKAINTASTNNKILGRRTFLPELFGAVAEDNGNTVYEGE